MLNCMVRRAGVCGLYGRRAERRRPIQSVVSRDHMGSIQDYVDSYVSQRLADLAYVFYVLC